MVLIARCDDLAQVTETLEINNVRSSTIDIGPNLTLMSITAASSVVAGASLSITDTVLNYGIQTAPASTTRYYLSLNTALDGNDIPLGGQRDVPPLDYNRTSASSATLQIPAGLSGAYYLLAVADGNGAIAEANETNNVKAKSLTITP